MFLKALAVLGLAAASASAQAQTRQASLEALAPAEQSALSDLVESNAINFVLIDSWFQNRSIQYYDFGPTELQPGGLYRVVGGHDIVSNIPGLPGYSHLLQIFQVDIAPTAGIDPNGVTSRDSALHLVMVGLARLTATGVTQNLPIVPDGSTLEKDPENRTLQPAVYKGRVVHYFDFGPSRVGTIPLVAFGTGIDRDGQLERLAGQVSNASSVPGIVGYSDMWAVSAAIGTGYAPGSYRDYRRALADARAGKFKLVNRGIRNCPVMYIEGHPAPRPVSGSSGSYQRPSSQPLAIPQATMASASSGPTAVTPVATVPVVTTPSAVSNLYVGAAGQTAVRTPKEDAALVVDGSLDEAAWKGAARLSGFSQYIPVDGQPAQDSTDVLVWYSPTAINFGIRAYETHGSAVHATLASRDKISGDDFIQIMLDTFNDQRRALVFGVNPLGIQSDGILSEGSQARSGGGVGSLSSIRDTVDLSADFVYLSKGRVTDWGYEAEISIPFKTLRYQTADVQTWGLHILRRVQHSGYENTWTPARQANPSFLGQAGHLEGISGISRGLVLDINPEVTGKATGSSSATGWRYDTDPVGGGARPDVGGNVRWGITNNLTLAGTANPDFSQVEADVQQVIADPRSAVNYPEKRPFFLEGSEQFDTPNQLIYTRRLVSPVAAMKLAGKLSGTGVGLLVGADDRAQSASKTDNPYYEMLRVRRDVGRQSSVGFVSTTRVEGSNYSQLAGADVRFNFARLWTVMGQGAETVTKTGTLTQTGPMWQATLDRSGRKYRFNYNMSGFHPDFIPAAGFQRRTNIAQASMSHRFTTFGRKGAFLESFTFELNTSANWWYKNNNKFLNGYKPNDPKLHFTGNATLRGGWRVGAATYFEYFSYDPGLFTTYRIQRTLAGGVVDTVGYVGTEKLYNIDLVGNLSTPQYKWGAATLSVITGQDENFFEWSNAWIWLITATADLRPTDKIRLSARYVRQLYYRYTDGTPVGDRQLPRLKIEYQLNRAIFLRFVGQYDIQKRDSLRDDSRTNFPVLILQNGAYSRSGIIRSNNLRVDWLFSFQPNPGTVLFAGYGSSMTETNPFRFTDIQRTGDGFFVKLSYLLRL